MKMELTTPEEQEKLCEYQRNLCGNSDYAHILIGNSPTKL